ncbi:MAG: xanthine dehydrogenase family protein molybdopterin-binding subunit [Hyphomicrobiaceae bacterium]
MDGATGKWTGRIEDDALLRGEGKYGDDIKPAGTAAAIFVRSPHAHARINSIDTTEASAMAGVIAVLTAKDFEDSGLGSVSGPVPIPGWSGPGPNVPFRPVLATDRAMHIGQPVALVIAETEAQAQDAADMVAVDYEPLDPAINVESAAAGSPQLWDNAPGNLALDWSAPNDPDGARRKAVDDAVAAAAHVTRIRIYNQRIAAVSMEPRVATASYDASKEKYTLRTGTQGVAGIQMQTGMAMKLGADKLRVLTDDVGGGFGMKASGYPEYPALLLAARQVGRPVHWASTRSEAFVSDNQARDQLFTAELALDKDGKILAMRIQDLANLGAYLTGVALYCNTVHLTGCLPTVYDIANIVVDSKGIFTNEVPIGPYRGAGRPEINYLVERLIDKAAREMAIDPAEIRRRNLIRPSQLPYKTFVGGSFDSGDFPGAFDKALKAADYDGFKVRKAEAHARGKRRGIGIGCFLEISGGHLEEAAAIRFPGAGIIHASIGASPQGQGHLTVFGKLVADRLGLPASAVQIQCGDSDRDVPGMGAVASRSAMLVGSALAVTADKVIEKGKAAAALLLQAGAEEVTYEAGEFKVAGSGNKITLFEVAERAPELVSQGALKETMDTQGDVHTAPSFPNGCHIAEVEIDPDTGELAIVNYVAVSDCGNVLDTVILEGQVHGGVAQGLGQAILEQMVYDPESGQVLTGSFMDYGMPRAGDVPRLQVLHHSHACTTNPVGAKGVGESGTTAAPSALVNAVIDAMPSPATALMDMPMTPEKIWRAFRA